MRLVRADVLLVMMMSWCIPVAAGESFFDQFTDPAYDPNAPLHLPPSI